jgi:hypothetical protein
MADDADSTDGTGEDNTGTDAGKTFTQAELDRIVSERVSRERAKFADYGDLKKKAASAMTEQERAVTEAEERGRTAALTATGTRLAKAEFKATAKGRIEDDALAGFLEYADLSKFIGADGEPNEQAIEAAVKKLAGPSRGTNFDGGARRTAEKPTDMNSLIRSAAGLG